MRELPVGLSYAVFTGIGAAGAVSLGVVIHGDPLRAGHLLAIALIVAGVVSARLAGAG